MVIRSNVLPLACGLFALSAAGAQAQVAGVYAGVTADDHPVSITIEGDPEVGFTATSTSVGFSATCGDGSVLDTGWGYNSGAAVRKGKLKTTTAGAYFTITMSLTFSSDNGSATGSIVTYSPSLRPIGSRPSRTTLCTSPAQALNLTLQPTNTATRYPERGAVMLGKTFRSPDPAEPDR